ncbi:MAG: molybdopterin cofactor-binding domain-containing protein [Myxococcota bacterium]
MRHGYYHACSVQRLEAGFDSAGRLTAWRHRVSSPSIATIYLPFLKRMLGLELGQGILDLALDVPNVSAETLPAPTRLRIGWLRSVFNINHGFAIQSFVDELARKQGVSTPEMLKTVLGPPRILTRKESGGPLPGYGSGGHDIDVGRWHGVIDDVVAQSGYQQDRDGEAAFGFGAHASFSSYVAAVVRVVRDRRGRPQVDEAWISVDAGLIANPDRCRAQMEGAVIFGATVALHGEITYRGGAVEQSNFHDYPILRMNADGLPERRVQPRRLAGRLGPRRGSRGGAERRPPHPRGQPAAAQLCGLAARQPRRARGLPRPLGRHRRAPRRRPAVCTVQRQRDLQQCCGRRGTDL